MGVSNTPSVEDSMAKPKTLKDLTLYHREKVLERARQWRLQNHSQVMELMRAERPLQGHPPTGAQMFEPSKWSASNWMWFTSEVLSKKLNYE